MKVQLFLFLVFLILVVSCKTQHKTPYEYEGHQIIFGQGGGFTGQITEYTLLENGQLFSGTNKEGFVDELESLDKNLAKQIFDLCERYGFADLKLNKPANQYYYFIAKEGNNANKILWGPGEEELPEELKILFGNLKRITKSKVLEKK